MKDDDGTKGRNGKDGIVRALRGRSGKKQNKNMKACTEQGSSKMGGMACGAVRSVWGVYSHTFNTSKKSWSR